jgi:hypothetical protein
VRRALVVLLACAGPDMPPPLVPAAPVASHGPTSRLADPVDPEVMSEFASSEGPDTTPGVTHLASLTTTTRSLASHAVEGPEVWLKGATHVHARASGDSGEPNAKVIAWYDQHRYDFIVLTDHNRVSELDAASDTRGQPTLRDPRTGLIVFSGIELTHNPIGCLPVGDPSGNCRIHVNLLGPTARPGGRLEWAERRSHARLDMYRAALNAQSALGGLAQLNHPQWLWGMNPELLVQLAGRGVRLIEVANSAFSKWNAGDATHPSTEALWDAALAQGATLWGTASDDAHDYEGRGKYPPGGGWVVVRARRNPQAILEALASGHFYASNGVVLERASVEDGALVIEVDPAAAGHYAIEFIENGRRVESIAGKTARRAVPAAGYLRAVVTRDDGKRAWVQPVRPVRR